MAKKDKQKAPRNGFLPMKTNLFDRIFVGVVILIAISLLWMRFLEPKGYSIYIATAISAVIGVIVAKKG